ncbi:MAG: formylglycine-generating enzyme family protein [Candidatus Solibacter usitatus]|nr:formylglycine-generating enzyme family protein [Candidatus Solibacter usitatus]
MVLFAAAAIAAEPGMVFIPGGEFQRGRTHKLPDDGLKWDPEVLLDDRPVRAIRVDAFYMDTYEVTNEQYAKFVAATKHRAPYNWPAGKVPEGKAKHPVAAVSWDDAMAYAKWAGKRLPTEAEWERACRGLTEGAKYSWGERRPTNKDARFTANGPADVGMCAANSFGLFDMSGNVWEWTLDYYSRDYYASAPQRNPKGPEKGMYRVLRGGSWADVEKFLTCAYRSWARPAERSPNIGFRCVKPIR